MAETPKAQWLSVSTSLRVVCRFKQCALIGEGFCIITDCIHHSTFPPTLWTCSLFINEMPESDCDVPVCHSGSCCSLHHSGSCCDQELQLNGSSRSRSTVATESSGSLQLLFPCALQSSPLSEESRDNWPSANTKPPSFSLRVIVSLLRPLFLSVSRGHRGDHSRTLTSNPFTFTLLHSSLTAA